MTTRRYTGPEGPAVELPRGDITEGVVRIGGTVRRPAQPFSAAVADYLDHLASAGFDGSPRYLGKDRAGRDVLTYMPGEVRSDPPEAWVSGQDLLVSVAELLKRLHEASNGYAAERAFAAPNGSEWMSWPLPRGVDASLIPAPPRPELISHNDITPQNVVVRDGRAVALVDFDLAGPTSRLLEVWVTAKYWVPLRDPEDVWPTWGDVSQASRLRVFADAYGLSSADRQALMKVGVDEATRAWWRMRGAAENLGGGWARMWAAGSGDAIKRRHAGGQLDPGDLTGQVEQALRNTARALAGGGASFTDVVRLRFFVTQWHPDRMGAFMAGVENVADELGLTLPVPPTSLIGVEMLFEPDVLVEVEAYAVLD